MLTLDLPTEPYWLDLPRGRSRVSMHLSCPKTAPLVNDAAL